MKESATEITTRLAERRALGDQTPMSSAENRALAQVKERFELSRRLGFDCVYLSRFTCALLGLHYAEQV